MKNEKLKMKKDIEKLKNKLPLIIWLLLALFLIRAFIYGTFVPAWQGPDEPLHYDYIHFIQTEKSLPVLGKMVLCKKVKSSLESFQFSGFVKQKSPYYRPQEVDTTEIKTDINKHTGNSKKNQIAQHPPLYYLLAAIISWPFKDSSLLMNIWLLRMVSALLGLGIVLLTYLIVNIIYERNQLPAIAACAFVALNPMFAHISTLVNNDALANFLFVLFIFLLTKACKDGMNTKLAAGIGLIITAGILTKFFFVLALPLTAIAAILFRKTMFQKLALSATLILSPLILTVPYYIRNVNIYGTLQPVYKFNFANPKVFENMSFIKFSLISGFATKYFYSFWSNFGWVRPNFSKPYFQVLAVISFIAIVGLTIYFIRLIIDKNFMKAKFISLFIVAPLMLTIAIALNTYKQAKITGIVEGVQGRYLFSLIPILGLFLFLGVRQVIPFKRGYVALTIIIGGLIILDLSAIFYYILPYFYF